MAPPSTNCVHIHTQFRHTSDLPITGPLEGLTFFRTIVSMFCTAVEVASLLSRRTRFLTELHSQVVSTAAPERRDESGIVSIRAPPPNQHCGLHVLAEITMHFTSHGELEPLLLRLRKDEHPAYSVVRGL